MWVWPPEPAKQQVYEGLTADFHDAEVFMHLEEQLQVVLICFLVGWLDWVKLIGWVVDRLVHDSRSLLGVGRLGYILYIYIYIYI